MESVERSAVTPKKGRLARTFAKVLHIRAATGVAPVDGIQKIKSEEKFKDDRSSGSRSRSQSRSRCQSFDDNENDEKLQNRVAVEALLAKLFASVSSVKAAYAQLQVAQFPYDAEGIQSADQMVVSELKNLSESKQCYLKKRFDSSPENTMLLAEIQEQKSLLKTYDIMGKKLGSQAKIKDSEIASLREKLEECNRQNKSIEKRLNSSGSLSVLDNLHLSGVSPSHFITVLRHTVKSIRTFVRLMVHEMESAGWDFDAAASAIEPGVVYWKVNHKCYTLESFVCREMFDAFHFPNFSLPNETLPEKKRRKQLFFERFVELKSVKPKEFLAQKHKSTFAKFCRVKYLQLVHPKMESSLFGNLSQRNLVSSGGFPETTFFASFSEMAKRVWLLHCLAFSFEPEASIFQVSKNCRFSELYMESVTDEAVSPPDNTPETDSRVAFTVVPGFKIGKTIIQCQVYLSRH
ncbi:hypothetical protein L1049_001328 [Liquidambar formosana]|uniref:DUF641 domain-containing protein n=1 Tax=Liquidambar formosana TaxID=63359 RepID=A0AAP0NAE8_LIQFO